MGVIQVSDLPKWAVTILVSIPIVLVIGNGIVFGGGEIWQHVLKHSLSSWALNSALVIIFTGLFTLIAAVPSAWLVTYYDFQGRAIFEWSLILPLAIPGYVSAIAYTDLLGVAGPIQSLIQNSLGLTAKEYWFPDVRNTIGCAFVLASNLFPYVYLTSRAAFIHQTSDAIEASRTLGATQSQIFFRIALPTALPAIIAGLSLALMETAADYGAADFLGVNTLTTGLVRTWQNFGDVNVAARIACVLILIAVMLRITFNFGFRNRGAEDNNARWRSSTNVNLSTSYSVISTLYCTLILLWGFLIPVSRLVWLSLENFEAISNIGVAARNTVFLSLIGTLVTILFGLLLVFGSSLAGRIAKLATTSSYATPGAVIAIGAIIIASSFKIPLAGISAILILAWVYACRFATVGIESINASLQQTPAGIFEVARTLETRPLRRILKIDARLALPGILVAILVVFVEILKELPATLILRPFNWDTLAVRAYSYASDDRLGVSALPCLLIIFAGLIPVSILCRQLANSRHGVVT